MELLSILQERNLEVIRLFLLPFHFLLYMALTNFGDLSDVIGKGNPIRLILGKSKMILGFSEGIPTMLKGEIAMVSALDS